MACWTSDARFSIAQLPPADVKFRVSTPLHFVAGSQVTNARVLDGVEIKRLRAEGEDSSDLTAYSLIPAMLLNGTIPHALLSNGLQWWLCESNGLLVGEYPPASMTRHESKQAHRSDGGGEEQG